MTQSAAKALPGMSTADVGVIEDAQPYTWEELRRPNHPLRLLQELSNTDKHQDLLTVMPNFINLTLFWRGDGGDTHWCLPRVPPVLYDDVVAEFGVPEEQADQVTGHSFQRTVCLTH